MAYGLITTRSLLVNFFEKKDGNTSELEKRCVYDVMSKPGRSKSGEPVRSDRERLSRAYAICRSSLQKSGRIKKGGMDLTKLGKSVSRLKAKKADHAKKMAGWKKALVKARKNK